MVERIVNSGAGPYPVVVTSGFEGLRERLPAGEAVVVTDTVVAALWLEPLLAAIGDQRVVVLPEGEVNKGWENLRRAVDGLLAHPIDRRTPVLALGGGVVGDVVGLAAALVMRGLPWVVLPTTLLAMVDAAVGGKTAINVSAGKNLVGAFHSPRLVWAAVDTLGTLPSAERRCGVGEVVKTAVVGDPALLDALVSGPASDAEWVERCVAVKAAVVEADERETGARMWLNAGHTVGHALEVASNYQIPHGEAVGLGLITELRWAVARGVCVDAGLPDRVVAALAAHGCSTRVGDLPLAGVVAAMALDKKAAGDTMRIPVAVRAGSMTIVAQPRDALSELLEHLPA